MNKTFNDPNTKYSDQGTPLAQAADALNAIGDVTETVDELAETVDELSEKVELIPEPTVANAGKVLTVTVDSSGETPVAEYGLATPSGGNDDVVIFNVYYDDNAEAYKFTKTYAELQAASAAGKILIGVCLAEGVSTPVIMPFPGASITISVDVVTGNNRLQHISYTLSSEDVVTYGETEYTLTPVQ